MRTPKSPDQAREQVRELKTAGVDAIKAVLESGRTGMLFARHGPGDVPRGRREASAQQLPLVGPHRQRARRRGCARRRRRSIEHGSFSDAIPDAVLARMAKDGIAYDPTLSVLEGDARSGGGRDDLLRRSLVQQAVSQKLLTGTRGGDQGRQA